MTADLTKTLTAPEDRSRRPFRSRDPAKRSRSTPEDELHQLHSPQFMDDHGAHHYHAHTFTNTLDDASTISDIEDSSSSANESIEEVRFGIRDTRDSRDAEANLAEVRSEKSARSIKDPTLVGQPQPGRGRSEAHRSIFRLRGRALKIPRIPRIGLIGKNGLPH